MARGLAPALVLIVSVGAGQSVSATQIAAIGLIATGVTVLRTTGGMSKSGFALGVATAACIAGYTLVDKGGLRHADPLPYLELAMLVPALGYLTIVVHRKGAPSVRRCLSVASMLAGVGVFAAYALTLAALARGAAAPVAAVRETGIVSHSPVRADPEGAGQPSAVDRCHRRHERRGCHRDQMTRRPVTIG